MATPSSPAQKRCYYDVLGISQTSTQEEIRSAYKKLALQLHPDKQVQSGIASEQATASFQVLVHAYEVLSDPKERSWYDSHKSQILYASNNSGSTSDSAHIFDLFSYFSPSCYTDYNDPKTGFYKVYGDVFGKIYDGEVGYCKRMGLSVGLVRVAPVMGDMSCDYSQVNAFYGYWLSFSTVMDFGWVDKWDAGAGVNRKSRRVMEEENKKLRKKAKKEYNDTVRGLAEFVKKRDKRVIDMMVVKAKEREKKREEEVRKKMERERERLDRVRLYEEPEWAKVDEEEGFDEGENEEEEEMEEKNEFYCVACGKKFKSDKQWRNHEQSRKHKEKIAELRKSFVEEDEVEEDAVDEGKDNVGQDDGFVSSEELEEKFRDSVELEERASKEGECHTDDEYEIVDADELKEMFEDSVGVEEEKVKENDELHSHDEDGVDSVEEFVELHNSVGSHDDDDDDDDDELSILKAMISDRKKKKVTVDTQGDNVQLEEQEVDEPMEYNNKKGKKKSRRAKKEKGKNFEAETSKADYSDNNAPHEEPEEDNGLDDLGAVNGARDDDQANYDAQNITRTKKQKDVSKRETGTRAKNSSKGKKQKDKSKKFQPVCEKCGEEFDSRNKLYKHLSETGHASLKFR